MHTSSNVKVLISTDGTPIIEKCIDIKFGSEKPDDILDVQDFDTPDAGQAQSWTIMTDEEISQVQAIRDDLPQPASHADNIEEYLMRLGIKI